ncbi:hybrid sensor histidine kinase/response regulator [Castellaniella defragrans]|uniref:histidine kinase n=1 Tax=Castellaniella defragrans TaxID=75697 RepID=A0A7W9TMN6_CASDE|nr:hybrid sensor histidine kinase/response regulator [Castellaniella defragrans]KAB0601595.1 hybrid sensor histidine kinase/response regulator [Castellaniella defragrans]MBB6083354.1 signal transduction histidine kinase [Castellaniella defragrans]
MARSGPVAGWRLDYLFSLARHSWLIHLGVVALLGLAWQHGINLASRREILIWFACMLTLSAAMLILARTYTRRWPDGQPAGPAPRAARAYGILHSLLTTLAGLGWGLGALWVARDDPALLPAYSLALEGTALGAVSSQHALPRSCLLSLWTSLPLLALAYLRHDPAWWYGGINAVMVLLYCGLLTLQSWRMGSFLARNAQLSVSLNARLTELTATSQALDEARRQAEDASMAKSRFLVQASHDLRQPIHAIGLLAAALHDTRLDTGQRELVGGIERAVGTVSGLFQSLLDISRLDVGGIRPHPQPLDLGELLRQAWGQAQPQWHASRQQIAARAAARFRLFDPPVWVCSDPGLLSAIVQNLLTNAIKYGQGDILLGIRRGPDGLSIQISDQGPGIAPEQMDAIFEEFYRIETPHGPHIDGLGLGLTIVRRLARLLQLRVRVRSRIGRGTTFRVSGLQPCAPQDGAPAQDLWERLAHPLKGRPVCLIDDDPEVLAAGAGLLRRWGCTVHAYGQPPDTLLGMQAIISDFDLGPGQADGLQTVLAIREREGWDVPALIVAGRMDAARERALAAAGIAYLPKPVPPVELRAWLMRHPPPPRPGP